MGTRKRDELSDAGDAVESRWDNTDDCHTITSRERIRRQLEADMEAFLASGGEIQRLDTTAHSESYVEQVGDNDLF